MKDNHNVNARFTSTNRRAASELFYKAHAEDGVHFLTDTNAAPTIWNANIGHGWEL